MDFLKLANFGVRSLVLYRPVSFVKAALIYLGIIQKPEKLCLWNGTKFYIRGKSDLYTLGEVYIRKVYGSRIRNGSVVIDLGAHIGIFSIWAAKSGDNVRVVSYEPSDENFEALSKNVSLNKLQEKISLHKAAVTSRKGRLDFFLSGNQTTNSIFRSKGTKKSIVDSVRLEDVFAQNRLNICSLLKIDVEGAEYGIIRSSGKVLEKIGEIGIEYHNGYEELKQILESHGFQVSVMKSVSGYESSYLYATRLAMKESSL